MFEVPEYFDAVVDNFENIFNNYFINKDDMKFLQIGGYSGRSSEWILKNVKKTCTLIDIDTWNGSPSEEGHVDNYKQDFSDVEKIYDSRIKNFDNVIKFKGTSDSYFESIKDQGQIFDFIYVDGSHKRDDVYNDSINSYRHLKVGGIIAFDDYYWNIDKPQEYIPHFAIKRFISEHKLKILIDENNKYSDWSQLWAMKI